MSVKGFWYLAAADLYIRSCIIADWFFFSFFFCLIHEVIKQCATLPAIYLFIWYFTLAKGGSRMFSCFTLAEGCSECLLLYACWRMQQMFVTVHLLKDAAEWLLFCTHQRMQQNVYCFTLVQWMQQNVCYFTLAKGSSRMFVALHLPKDAAECLLFYTSKGCSRMFVVLHF